MWTIRLLNDYGTRVLMRTGNLAWIWQKQIDELSKKYRVIAVDPRSQGESDKPTYGHPPETRGRDYKELVDQLGLKQPVLIGWSMGCGELLSYVEQFGDDGISGLVLAVF